MQCRFTIADPDGHGLTFATLSVSGRAAILDNLAKNSTQARRIEGTLERIPMLSANIKDIAIVFMVADLARTHRFYTETLGIAFEVEDIAAAT